MKYTLLLIASLATSISALPSLKRQSGDNSPCQPGDELACCAAENDETPIMGDSCTLNILGDNCGIQINQCCNVNQNGTININVACIAVPVRVSK